MPMTVPIRDLKDTAAFADAVISSHTPTTATRNGVGTFAAMRREDFDAIAVNHATLRPYERMELAEREHALGK